MNFLGNLKSAKGVESINTARRYGLWFYRNSLFAPCRTSIPLPLLLHAAGIGWDVRPIEGSLNMFILRALAYTAFLLGSSAAHADTELQSYLTHALAWMQNRDHNPAIAALIQMDGKVAAEAVVGSRALGHPQPATVNDRWHIGSDTKAFTATLIGTLVDRQVVSLDDTLETSLPALANTMHPAYRRITIRQLLSHTAGLPPLTNTETEFPTAQTVVRSVRGVSAQRMALARYFLSKPPASAAGTFRYSNLGYIIAGAIAESRTGESWEDLMSERVFIPLGIRDAGFGPPGHSGRYDQPLGHGEISGREPLDPADPGSDGPAWLGPAGSVNISLKDWAMFAQDQLDGAIGHGKLLKQSTYKALQTPVADHYALGWGASLNSDGTPKVLTHEGSNGFWVAAICIYPKQGTIILMTTNFGGDIGKKSIEDLGAGLASHLNLPLGDGSLAQPQPASVTTEDQRTD